MLLDENSQIWDIDDFKNESELENVVFDNYQLLYGDQSLLFGKKIIKTESGVGTVPDAFVVDLESREWYLVEVELLHHGVYRHIVPQITKQVNAANTTQMKSLLRQQFLAQLQNNNDYLQLFQDAEIPEIQIADTLESILCQPPRISIPIDKSSSELESWAKSLKYEVKIMEIARFKNRDTGKTLLQLPDIETTDTVGGQSNFEKSDLYSLRGPDIIMMLAVADLLKVGEVLSMKYKGKQFDATITRTGHLELSDGTQHSSSLAAIACVQSISPNRRTVNGLKAWRTKAGKSLHDLRDELDKTLNDEAA